MKEEIGCTVTSSSGGVVLGFSNKGFQDGKCSGVVQLGLKLDEKQPPFLCNQDGGGGDGGGGCCVDGKRPTSKETGAAYLSNITPHFSSTSSAADSTTTVPVPVASAASAPGDGGTGSTAVVSHLQPFDISYPTSYNPFFKSLGGGCGGMATTLGFFPFTATQWKELQRQAMVYKYMVACVPVPHDLLFPIDPSGSASSWEKMGMFNVRWAGNGKDAEPGRCRRTDGKKWRCSKDVAPNQKYCERHLNRGRPRSRKPVEIHTGFSINSVKTSAKKNDGVPQNPSFDLLNLKTGANTSSYAARQVGVGGPAQGFDVNQGSSSPHFALEVSLPSANEEARGSKRMFKDEGIEQQWQQMEMKNVGLTPYTYNTTPYMFQHKFDSEPIDSESFLDFNSNKAANPVAQSWCLDSVSTPARGFIDAWSNGVPENNDENRSRQKSSDGKISPTSLDLSMGGSNLNDDEIRRIHAGHSVIDSSGNNGEGFNDHMSSWINPGGPLAEVLGQRPASIASLSSNAIFPNSMNADFVTPPSTTVSSPSGVLQKTLASFSDSSGSNSPIREEKKPKSQIPFQWLR